MSIKNKRTRYWNYTNVDTETFNNALAPERKIQKGGNLQNGGIKKRLTVWLLEAKKTFYQILFERSSTMNGTIFKGVFNSKLEAGTFWGGEIPSGTFHSGDIEKGTFYLDKNDSNSSDPEKSSEGSDEASSECCDSDNKASGRNESKN